MKTSKYEVELPTVGAGWCFRARRVQFGMTLDDLARVSGVGINSVRRAENGERVSTSTLLRLAPHLRLTKDQVLALWSLQETFVTRDNCVLPEPLRPEITR
jgi:transcriptional regulator with XRE-family HTH domain